MQNRNQEMMKGAYPDLPVVAVGAVVFKNGRVLLVKRSNPPSQGDWAIPGGRVKLGETLRQAAEREILEETGIVIQAKEPVFTFETIKTDPAGAIRFHYVIIDLAAEYISGEPCPDDDALDARWVAPDDLNQMQVVDVTRRLLETQFGFGA